MAKSWNEIEREVYANGRSFTNIAFDHLQDKAQIVRELRRAFSTAMKKGESAEQLVKRVQKITGKCASDAARIVRTETTIIENTARQNAANDYVKKTGKAVKKRWFCTFHNSRDSHKKMHNQSVRYDLPFHTPDGLPMMFPGDGRNVGPGEICNCRCRMVIMGGK